MFAKVLVPLPLPPLTYRLPEDLQAQKGDFVQVKVRKKSFPALIISTSANLEEADKKYEIKEIDQKLPLRLEGAIVDLLVWSADYYIFPAGEVLKYFLPDNLQEKTKHIYTFTSTGKAALSSSEKIGRAQKALLQKLVDQEQLEDLASKEKVTMKKLLDQAWASKTAVAIDHSAQLAEKISTSAPPLNTWQIEALRKIRNSIGKKYFHSFLLQGVTGSGKTEVYLETARTVLDSGRNVLVLDPEISLTPQLVDRFRRRLGVPIAVLHSGMTNSERSKHWHLLHRGKVRVCIGVRSAIFAPISNLGVIIVDEEHDGALKQEDRFRYHARDLALVRAKFSSCTVLLGSATPSLESFFNVKKGKLEHLLLPERATSHSLPVVTVVDQKHVSAERLISPLLKKAMDEALKKREQVMLLLNRRGFSSFLICHSCGDVPTCPNCSVSLTFYKSQRKLKCHYCEFNQTLQEKCSKCADGLLQPSVEGTEALEEEVRSTFPAAMVLRMDRENMSKRGAIEAALESVHKREIDILIGTQMIAKGHDFPSVSVVGMINTDSSLHIPDFRAPERCFQLFTQMAGRAGRGLIEGRVFLQTFQPEHPSIRYSIAHDYLGFVEQELAIREEFHYPPYARLARILLSSTDARQVETLAEQAGEWLSKHAPSSVSVLGPAPAVLAKILNRYRWSLLLKSAQAQSLHSLLEGFHAEPFWHKQKKVMIQFDIDPLSLL